MMSISQGPDGAKPGDTFNLPTPETRRARLLILTHVEAGFLSVQRAAQLLRVDPEELQRVLWGEVRQ